MVTELAAKAGVREEPRSHGLTGWLRAKLFGPKATDREQMKARLMTHYKVIVLRSEGGGKTLATIDRGECFGEMAYLSGQSRAATVVATTDSILMKIRATLLDRSPTEIQLLFLKQFAMTLLKRLAKSNQQKA